MAHAQLDAIELPAPSGAWAPPSELKLFGDGWNDTKKGRFLLDADGAQRCLAAFAEHGVELAMDFDHSTFAEPGARRDVPGYIGALDYRPGDGLYATKLRWTEVGLRAIRPGPEGAVPEYRYLSPAIQFDPESRRITALEPVALVTWPATHNQRPLVLGAPGDTPMKTVLSALALPDTATEAQARAALDALKAERDALVKAAGAADAPGAVVAIERLRVDHAALSAQTEKQAREALVARGRAEKKLTPALEQLYAARPVADLEAFLAAAPVIEPLARVAHTPPTQQPGAGDPAVTKLGALAEKPFETLSPHEKAQLLRASKAVFGARIEEAATRLGASFDAPRYRSMLG